MFDAVAPVEATTFADQASAFVALQAAIDAATIGAAVWTGTPQ